MDNSVNGIRSTVSQDAVQEFQILTNGYAAEYGQAAAGVINIISKSGSNDFMAARSDICATATSRRPIPSATSISRTTLAPSTESPWAAPSRRTGPTGSSPMKAPTAMRPASTILAPAISDSTPGRYLALRSAAIGRAPCRRTRLLFRSRREQAAFPVSPISPSSQQPSATRSGRGHQGPVAITGENPLTQYPGLGADFFAPTGPESSSAAAVVRSHGFGYRQLSGARTGRHLLAPPRSQDQQQSATDAARQRQPRHQGRYRGQCPGSAGLRPERAVAHLDEQLP